MAYEKIVEIIKDPNAKKLYDADVLWNLEGGISLDLYDQGWFSAWILSDCEATFRTAAAADKPLPMTEDPTPWHLLAEVVLSCPSQVHKRFEDTVVRYGGLVLIVWLGYPFFSYNYHNWRRRKEQRHTEEMRKEA